MMRRQTDMDPLERALASLPVHEPAADRRGRIRERAHCALQRPRFGERFADSLESVRWPRAIESAIVSAAAVYLAEVLRLALSLSGHRGNDR